MKLDVVESELPKIKGADYKSPVKFELEIQRQRILYILHHAIKKMEIMAALPVLLKKRGELLQPFLKPTELDFVLYACSKYKTNSRQIPLTPSIIHYTQILDNISLNNYEEEEHLVKNLLGSLIDNEKIDYYISQVIQIISTNKSLVQWLKENPQDIEPSVINVIKCMRHLKQIVHEKLMISSEEQTENDKKLRNAFKSNFLITQSIAKLQDQMDKQRKELGSELEQKNATLKTYQDKLKQLHQDFEAEVAKKVQDSEKKMMDDYCASEARQAELAVEAHDATNAYANLLESNLREESQLRAKRNKVESQLASWLLKYDTDVGEKQEELEKLEAEIAKLEEKFDELKIQFEDQSEEYDALMAERDAENRRIYEEKAYHFLMNRSARIIQSGWRAYWKRKLERKRMRKGGKGAKAEKKTKRIKSDKEKLYRTTDAREALAAGIKNTDLLQEMDTTKTFDTKPVTVSLD